MGNVTLDMSALFRALFYIAGGYLLGGVLFSQVVGKLFKHKDFTEESSDKNPGTANAFMYGGFWCGVLTLCGDVGKGFLPVFFYMRNAAHTGGELALALVIAAPVIGHIFPLFFGHRGGKGIATTFGCLFGLIPGLLPFFVLAASFIFFSLVLRITPHYHRTIFTYVCTAGLLLFTAVRPGVKIGFIFICVAVLIRMKLSTEEREKMKVRLLWKR